MTPVTFPTTFVEQQAKDASFYYNQRWLDLITTLYGYHLIPLTVTDADGQVTGFLPLCAISSPLTGRRLVSLPFSDHCPLLATDAQTANALIEQAITLAKKQKVRYLELRTGTNEYLANHKDLEQADLYVRWLLPLNSNTQTVWSLLRKPIQHQIKKSRKMGVTVRIAEQRAEVEHYYKLHLQTRSKKHGMPSQPASFFYSLWDHFAADNIMKILLAEHEGNVIAGMVILASGTTIRYAYGASDERFLHLSPNNLLMWHAIEWGCQQGYQTLDMGRTAQENEGLMEYKRRWGAQQEALCYYYYPATAGLASTSEHSPKFRLLTNAWRRLPISITRPLSSLLYRHLG